MNSQAPASIGRSKVSFFPGSRTNRPALPRARDPRRTSADPLGWAFVREGIRFGPDWPAFVNKVCSAWDKCKDPGGDRRIAVQSRFRAGDVAEAPPGSIRGPRRPPREGTIIMDNTLRASGSVFIGSKSSAITAGRDGDRRWWRVAGDRAEMTRSGNGWDARVERAGWAGLALELDGKGGHFASEAEALAWCERMVEVLRETPPTGKLRPGVEILSTIIGSWGENGGRGVHP